MINLCIAASSMLTLRLSSKATQVKVLILVVLVRLFPKTARFCLHVLHELPDLILIDRQDERLGIYGCIATLNDGLDGEEMNHGFHREAAPGGISIVDANYGV